jgi:hypothetical protein
MFEGSINTITKGIKLISALAHPILEHASPVFNLVQI